MPNLTPLFYDLTNTIKTQQYIETGSYLGYGIKCVLNNYNYIHSIELSQKWYDYNIEQFKNNLNVKMHLGDSKKILPNLLNTINEPITIFLDAHYSGNLTSLGDEETPLLYELNILKNRKYDDIIIIDDCRMLGNTGFCGCEIDHPIYPIMFYNWTDITNDKIINLMKENYILLKNENHIYTDGAEDQYILVKNNIK